MKKSKSALNREKGMHQVEKQRESILDAAEKLFLQNGLENTKMIDIATQAGITKVTLYRYFPNRDPIAFEVAVRMLKNIVMTAAQNAYGGETSMDMIKGLCLGMIREFPALRGAYRFVGMFDHLYADHYPSDELASWYKQHISALPAEGSTPFSMDGLGKRRYAQVITLFNTIMSFMEKMAARGDLMAEEQEISVQAQLEAFEEIVLEYLRSLEGEQNE